MSINLPEGRSRFARLFAVLVIALTAVAFPALGASAHGALDQSLAGDPACDATNFPGYVISAQDLRQEFVPSAGGLGAVELCLNILTPGTTLTLNIYEEGQGGIEPTPPGRLIRSQTLSPSTGFRFVHVDLDPELGITPGVKHVLEIPRTQVTFQWRAACGTTLNPCNRSSDPYAKGTTNFHPDIVDFGFRTKPAQLPDLLGTLTGPRVVCPGQALGSSLTATVRNLGAVGAAGSRATLFLSPDETITSADTSLGTVTVPALSAGEQSAPDVSDLRVPNDLPSALTPDRRAFFGLIVDDRGDVAEANEQNNVTAAPVALTACAHASISEPTVTADRAETAPGAFRVPIADVDADNLPIIPEESATVSSFDIESTPILPVDLTSLFDGAPSSALDQILLSSLPYCCWRAILDAPGSPFAGMPLHAVSLADALSLDPDVTLQETSLATSGLKGITAAAILSAGTPVNDLGLPGAPWCDMLAARGFDCATRDFNPASDTLLDLNLLGFRAVPWNLMPSATQMDFAAASPIRTTPLAGSSGADHYQILQTPLRTVRVASLTDPGSIIDCGALPNGCGAGSPDTLGTVENAGAFRSGAKLGALLDALPDEHAVSLGSVALGIFAREDLAWELMDHDKFKPQAAAPFGDPLTYTVRFTNDGPVTLVDPSVEVALPHNFLSEDEPATVSASAGSSATAPIVMGDTVRFGTTALVAPGASMTLSFKVYPWVRLGSFSAAVAVNWVDAGASLPDHQHGASASDQAPVRVVDIETAVPNNEGAVSGEQAAPTLQPDTLLYTTIGPDDQDFFTIPALPAGSKVKVTMTSTAAPGGEKDFDMALYRLNGARLDSLPILPVDLTSLPIPEDGWEVNSTGSRVSPEMLDDLPIFPVDLSSLSVNRQSSNEALSFTVSSGDGPLLLQVFGYNGAFGVDPVVLRVKATPPPSLGPCTTPAPANTGQRASTATWTPSGLAAAQVQTLFVFDQDRTGDLYGAADASAVRSKLEQVAARADVKGMILSVDADARPPVPGEPGATVPTARAAADADRCSVEASNDVVRAITSLIGTVRPTMPDLRSIVVAGSNDVIPSYFARDYTWKSNEIDNVQDMLDATGNTVLTTAIASRHFQTDAPFGATNSVAFLNERVYPPAYALGRLAAEDADGVVAQLQRFIDADGKITPSKAAVASIDILDDGAKQVAGSVATRLGIDVDRLGDDPAVAGDGWTADDLKAKTTTASPAPGIVSVGAHATHRALLASRGGTLKADDVVGSALGGGVVAISNGCHFGLNLPNRAVTDAGSALDWTEAYISEGAAAVIGSTGFAYADRSGVAYSEDLMRYFAAWIGNGTLGDAWKHAIDDYMSSLLAIDAFDHKTVGEFTFNGMPHYKIAGIDAAPPAVPDVVGTVQADNTGLMAGPISVSFDPTSPSSRKVVHPDGTYYTWNGEAEAKNGYPIVARSIGDVREPGLNPQDIMVTGLRTIEEANDPVFAGAVVASKESAELQSSSAVSPTLPVRLTMNGKAVFRLGRFRGEQIVDGNVVGSLLRVTGVDATVYYGQGGKRPVFKRTEAEVGTEGGQQFVRFTARMDPATTPVKVLALYRDQSGWRTASFTRSASDPTVWTARGPMTGAALLDTFVQALGPTGRVGVTAIKGVNQLLLTPVTIEGPRGANGWFKGPVTIELNTAGGTTFVYSLNGGNETEYVGPFEVGEEGINELVVSGSDGTSLRMTIPIDTTAPTVTIANPSEGETFDYLDPEFLGFSCSDQTSGLASCSAAIDGEPSRAGASLTTSAGPHTLTVTAVDSAGLTTTVTRGFTVVGYTFEGFSAPLELRPPKLNDRKAGDTIPLKWKVFAPNGVEMTDLAVVKSIQQGRISCTSPSDASQWGPLTNATSNPAFRYAGQFTFTAQSDRSLEGLCSRYVVTHADASTLMVFVRHTKA